MAKRSPFVDILHEKLYHNLSKTDEMTIDFFERFCYNISIINKVVSEISGISIHL